MQQMDNAYQVSVPGSKSITQRALVTTALANGLSKLHSALDSQDTRLLRDALRQMGIDIKDNRPDLWIINGIDGKLKAPDREIYMGNNGTGIRFLISLAALIEGTTILAGNKRMEERPAGPLLSALQNLGVEAVSINGTGCPPLKISSKGLKGGEVKLSASVSSQFLSSLLLASPYAKTPIKIILDGKLVSRPYVDITLRVMSDFGIEVIEKINNFYIPTGHYQARDYSVEADASSASYFFGAAAVTGKAIRVNNLPLNPIQGDADFVSILEKMGCIVEKSEKGTMVQGPPEGKLRGLKIDMGKWPDVVPTLAVVAAFAKGETIIRNVAHLRIKETDRIKAVVKELNRIGCSAQELEDGLIVKGYSKKLHSAQIKTYDDHRIAMCFAIAGLRIKGLTFDDYNVVSKSFPDFWQYWEQLRNWINQV